MSLRCAILDDYQQVALPLADWTFNGASVEVFSLAAHYDDESALAAQLADCAIIVVMRERTPITDHRLANGTFAGAASGGDFRDA